MMLRALTVLLVLCGAALTVLIVEKERHPPAPPPVAATAPQSLGQFIALAAPLPAPALTLTPQSGAPKTLSDFAGHWVLVNLWATWCAPCVAEMPALDRLQEKLGSKLAILAVSEDRRGAEAVAPFLARHDVKQLAVFLDPKSTAIDGFGAQGLPTSFLIAPDSKIVGKLEGAAKWDEAPMLDTIERYVAAK